jgi:hypothetical protein
MVLGVLKWKCTDLINYKACVIEVNKPTVSLLWILRYSMQIDIIGVSVLFILSQTAVKQLGLRYCCRLFIIEWVEHRLPHLCRLYAIHCCRTSCRYALHFKYTLNLFRWNVCVCVCMYVWTYVLCMYVCIMYVCMYVLTYVCIIYVCTFVSFMYNLCICVCMDGWMYNVCIM